MRARLALVAALAVALVACNKVDEKDMAKKIKDAITEKLSSVSADIKVKSVECPSGKDMKEGNAFDCTVTFGNDKTVPAHIEIQKDKQFSWKIDPDDLTSALEK